MFWSILVFFLVLSLLVIVHEFGHYIVAKKNGIWVEEFGFGLPPRVFGKKNGDTIYSINALPFGGFVRLHGEMTDPSTGSGQVDSRQVFKKNKAFLYKSLWVKTAVIIAGVFMNFILAIFAFALVYSHYGIPREQGFVEIVNIVPDSPAANTAITVGQRLYSIDGKEVKKREEVTEVSSKGGKHVLMVGEKNADKKDQKKITIDTKFDEKDQRWYMGLVLTSQEVYFPPAWQMPFVGAYHGFKDSFAWSKTVLGGLSTIAQDASQGKVSKEVSGPVGILAIVDNIVKTGNVWDLINLIGIISINLAVLNILPFPALDGGRQLFIIIEAIFGKKVAPKLESVIHGVGMVILLALMLLITFKDVRGLISAGSISGFLDNMTK